MQQVQHGIRFTTGGIGLGQEQPVLHGALQRAAEERSVAYLGGLAWNRRARRPTRDGRFRGYGFVRTYALIVAHRFPSAAPLGRIVYGPTAAGMMNVSA